MTQHIQRYAWLSLLLAAAIGCGSSSDSGGDSDMDDLAAMLNQPKPAPNEELPAEEPAKEPEPAPAPAEEPPQPQYTAPEEVTAKDPQRGRVFHNQPGYLDVLFSARFVAENQLTFGKVKHATDLYEATYGHKPKSHEEFMREIIEANYIELPPLRDNFEYWYNAERGELMMRQPIEE